MSAPGYAPPGTDCLRYDAAPEGTRCRSTRSSTSSCRPVEPAWRRSSTNRVSAATRSGASIGVVLAVPSRPGLDGRGQGTSGTRTGPVAWRMACLSTLCKLTHVPGPGIALEQRQRFGSDSLHFLAELPAEPLGRSAAPAEAGLLRRSRNARQADGVDVEPVVEVLAERPSRMSLPRSRFVAAMIRTSVLIGFIAANPLELSRLAAPAGSWSGSAGSCRRSRRGTACPRGTARTFRSACGRHP